MKIGDAKICRVVMGGFDDESFKLSVRTRFGLALVLLSIFMLMLQHHVDGATSGHRVLEEMKAEFEPSAAEANAHDNHGYGNTKMYSGSLEEELVLGPVDHSDEPQDVKFKKYSGNRIIHHDSESANRVQNGSTWESFGDGFEVATGPKNWITRAKYHLFPLVRLFTTLTVIVVVLFCALYPIPLVFIFYALFLILLSNIYYLCALFPFLRACRRSSLEMESIKQINASKDILMTASIAILIYEPYQFQFQFFMPVQHISIPVQGEIDDAGVPMEPLLRDQIKIALEPVLGPVTAALLHQGREERKQRQRMIAMEEQKLALKREKVRLLKRRRACRFQLTRRALATNY